MFDTEQFLAQSTDQSMSTKYISAPDGYYLAQCEDVQIFSGETDGKLWVRAQLAWALTDTNTLENLNVPEINGVRRLIARQTMFIDLTSQGHIDLGEGRNVALGRTREAVGQNKKGKPWAFNHLKGQTAAILIKNSKNRRSGDDEMNVTRVFDPKTVSEYATVNKRNAA